MWSRNADRDVFDGVFADGTNPAAPPVNVMMNTSGSNRRERVRQTPAPGAAKHRACARVFAAASAENMRVYNAGIAGARQRPTCMTATKPSPPARSGKRNRHDAPILDSLSENEYVIAAIDQPIIHPWR
jgi:hypothetical protein